MSTREEQEAAVGKIRDAVRVLVGPEPTKPVPVTGTQPAPTVPDEAVEAAARELAHAGRSRAFDADRMGAPTYEQVRAAYRDESRAALAAAAPFIVAANQPEPAHEVQCPNCDATIRARMADQPEVAEVERLRAQRDAVLALHAQAPSGFCRYCCDGGGDPVWWPCETVTTLAGDEAP